MAGPKASNQNIAQSITLPLLACLPTIVHPSARCFTWMHPAIHVKLKKTCSIESGHLFSLLHGPFLMLMCPLFQQWTGLSMGTQIDLWVCSIFSYMSMERDNQRYCPLLAIRRKCRFKTFPPDTKDCYRTVTLLFITEIISVQSQYY